MEEILKQLTDNDIKLINYYRQTYSNDNDEAGIDARELLQEWAKAKNEHLFKLFGNKLIIRKPIELQSSCISNDETSDCLTKLQNMTNDLKLKVLSMREIVKPEVHEALSNLCDLKSILANEYCGITTKINDYMLRNGCKTIKALKHLNSIFNFFCEEDFEKFRILQSMCTNTTKLSGNLCLSIHPMDYMTLSDNNCGWDSCLSWINTEKGIKRMGSVEMMNSANVIVAYLESAHPFRIGNYFWNSKKWRSLYVVTPEVVTNVKGYPYQCSAIDKIVTSTLYDLMRDCYPERVYTKPHTYIYPNLDNYQIHVCTRHMYDDFPYGATYWGFAQKENEKIKLEIDCCGTPQCMICGYTFSSDLSFPDRLTCSDCVPLGYQVCEQCGEILYDEDEFFTDIDGTILCANCYHEIENSAFASS